MTNFTGNSDAELDALILKCRTAEEIREVTKQHLENKGVILRDRESSFGAHVTGQSLPTETVQDEAGRAMYERVVRLPGGKSYRISGYTIAGLDQLEANLRGQQ